MTEQEMERYKKAMFLFCMCRYIRNNTFLPGIPTLPDIVECTVSFTNTTYPDLDIHLPDTVIGISGTDIVLPTISGEYEDTYNYYTPLEWSVGSFGEIITLFDEDITANLIFSVVPKGNTYTLSFTNTTYPQFDVSLPEDIIVLEGDSVTLPSVTGTFEDENNTYTPQEWNIGSFGESYTPSSSITTNLVWNVVPKIDPSDGLSKIYIVVNDQGNIGYSIGIEDVLIHQIQFNVPIITFYFTNLGDQETENTVLRSGESVDLYDAEGNLISDSKYDGVSALTFTQLNGNMIKSTNGGDLIIERNGHLAILPNTDYEAISVQVEILV